MKKIKIVHLTSSLKMGGAEQLLCDLLKSLNNQQFEHHVAYFHDGPHRACLDAMDIAYYQPQSKLRRYDPFFLYDLYFHIKKIKPDILHTNLWAANNIGRVIGALLGIPVVSVLHNYLDQDGWLKNKIDHLTVPLSNQIIAFAPGIMESLIAREKWQMQASDLEAAQTLKNSMHILYSSTSAQDEAIIATGLKLRKTDRQNWKPVASLKFIPWLNFWRTGRRINKLSLLNIGIDIGKLHANAQHNRIARAELNIGVDDFVIGTVGRFVPVKRYEFIIETFKLLHTNHNHARLLLVGTGPLEQSLRVKVAELNIHDAVIFAVDKPAYSFYPLFDCFILASEKEGPSLAMLEAMSFGIPIIRATIEKKHPVIRNQENGLLVDAYDAQAVVQAYTNLINDPALVQKVGSQGKKDVHALYDLPQLAHAYEKIFSCVMHNR